MTASIGDDMEMTAALKGLTDWLIQQGLENTPVESWFEECCLRLVAAGMPLQRVNMMVRAHHPEVGSVAFRWYRDGANQREDFPRRNAAVDVYLRSPLHRLLTQPDQEIRQRLDDPDPIHHFDVFDDFRSQGATDYFASKQLFMQHGAIDSPDMLQRQEGMIISMTTNAPGGFTDAQLDGLRAMLPSLCLTLKCGANRLMAEDISAVYMGRDASRRVLSGDIMRGSSETISAVIWYFDLQGFTRLSEALPGAAVIELLNSCFGEAVDVVERNGGNVLKFMGDGMLAIFDLNQYPDARRVAIDAALELRAGFKALNDTRAEQGLPITEFTLALHAGDVLYGNIGAKTRLDFTVIGPAVNTTARILGMTGPLDQSIVISSAVAKPLQGTRPELVSLGQYRLRGVSERQELFTLD